MSSGEETPSESDPHRFAAEAAATDWLVASDRGWTEAERRDFKRWLEADPLHAEAWTVAQAMWSRLDRLDELSPVAAAPRKQRRGWAGMITTAAAAAVPASPSSPRCSTGRRPRPLGRAGATNDDAG